jgi:hypothetical protein
MELVPTDGLTVKFLRGVFGSNLLGLAILIEDFRDSSQSLQPNSGILPLNRQRLTNQLRKLFDAISLALRA